MLSVSSKVHAGINAFLRIALLENRLAETASRPRLDTCLNLCMPRLHHIQSIGGHTSSPHIPRLYCIQAIDCIKMTNGLNIK